MLFVSTFPHISCHTGKAYKTEDFRKQQQVLPEEPKRKGTQLQRTGELNQARAERDAALREEAERDALALSAAQLEQLEHMMVQMTQKLHSQALELEKLKKERREVMAAKRQGVLSSWLKQPEGQHANLQLPTRASHFDVDVANATGYSQSELQRTFRGHVERVEHFIEDLTADPVKQLQLADAVNRRFRGIRSSMPNDNEAADYILESLRNFEATLRERFSGRYPNEIRAAHQAVCAGISSKIPHNKLSVVAEATGFSQVNSSCLMVLHTAVWCYKLLPSPN